MLSTKTCLVTIASTGVDLWVRMRYSARILAREWQNETLYLLIASNELKGLHQGRVNGRSVLGECSARWCWPSIPPPPLFAMATRHANNTAAAATDSSKEASLSCPNVGGVDSTTGLISELGSSPRLRLLVIVQRSSAIITTQALNELQ